MSENSQHILQQNNDQVIDCPITFDGVPINTADLDKAVYKIYSLNKKTEKLTKAIGSGITASGHTLTIEITKEDCKDLRGTFYHELTIVDPEFGESTVFKDEVTFQSTVNIIT
jgi:hypothetical protein